jgi:hypothetical protein
MTRETQVHFGEVKVYIVYEFTRLKCDETDELPLHMYAGLRGFCVKVIKVECPQDE